MDNDEIIKGLKETVIFLCICCGDIAGEEKINRMGEAINAAIEKMESRKEVSDDPNHDHSRQG